jgi:hypothetical protein
MHHGSNYHKKNFEDTKGVMNRRKIYNAMTKRKGEKMANNDLQNIVQKNKNRVT